MPIYELDNAGNYVLGAGYFLVRDPDQDNWHYLAQTEDLTVAVETERVELVGVDKPTAEVLEDVVTQITRTANTSFRNIERETLRRFFAASVSDVVEAGSAANTEQFVVELGAYIQLGTNDANSPAYGWRGVSSVSIVEDPGGADVALVLDTDYTLDAEEGMIKFLSDAVNVETGDTVEVTYDVDATTTEVLSTGANASEILEVKFVADNTRGANRTFHFPKVDMGPAGELALKSRDTFQQIPVTFEILDPNDGRAAAYILTKPA